MTTPLSHPQVSVEETENGYIVHAGSAVATISKTILGYAVDADSQILKEEYNLSPLVTNTRKSARDLAQLSNDTDDTRLILRASRSFLFLSHAVEMICGFLPENFPREDEWKLLSAWRSNPQVPAEPDTIGEACVVTESVDESVSSDGVSEELGTTLSDIVQDVDEAESEYQSNSWKVIPNKSAEKILDKSAFEYHETGVPKDVCDFFGATNLPPGGRKQIYLVNNSKRLTGHIIKDTTKSERVKLRWDDGVSDIISKSQKRYEDNLSLVFLKMLDLDTYNIIVRRVVGLKKVDSNTNPSVLEETRDNTESEVHTSQDRMVECSPDVLKIHEAVSKLPRYRFNQDKFPDINSGILLIFEDGEKYDKYDRIVHVTYTSGNTRIQRLINDIITGDGNKVSIRKYIEEAVILKDGVPYVTTEQRSKYSSVVYSYISEHLSYSIIGVKPHLHCSTTARTLIYTLITEYAKHPCSDIWLGKYHADPRIRKRGIWNIDKIDGRTTFDTTTLPRFLDEIKAHVEITHSDDERKEEKVEEIIETEIQRSAYKYSTPTGSIDDWKNLYLTVTPYRIATIKDMGTDFSLYDVSDSRNRTLLLNELTGIINIEGSISKYQLIRRVMDFHSIHRSGDKIEGNIAYSLQILVNQGRIRRSKDSENEYYSSRLTPILPRKRPPLLNISFSEISLDEIRVMIISQLLENSNSVINTLIRDIYMEFGYQSQITTDISHRIERVLNDMVCDGLVKIENQKVSLVIEKS